MAKIQLICYYVLNYKKKIIYRSFAVQNLKPFLRPSKLEKSKENFGPFIFTPINFGSMERKSNTTSNKLGELSVNLKHTFT